MKTQIKIATITVGLLSGVLAYAGDKDHQNHASQPGDSSAQQQEQSSIQSEAAGAENVAGQKIAFDDLPQDAQRIIRLHSGGLKIENLRKQTKNGETRYVATFEKGDMKEKLVVGEDGSLLLYQMAQDLNTVATPKANEAKAELSELPDRVQKKIKEVAGDAQIESVSKTPMGAQTVYHAGFREDGVHTDLFVNEAGNLIAKSQKTALFVAPLVGGREVQLSSAPEAVQKTIREKSAPAEVSAIDKGTWLGQTAYKVMIEKEGTPRALVIAENGNILGEDIYEAAGAEQNKRQQQQP